MALDLSDLLSAPLPPGTKGLPAVPSGFAARDIAAQGWSLLADDLPMPVAVLRAGRLQDNIAAMQAYLATSGVLLAPHGKTTMCPQLFDRQLAGGAWGMTVATIAQARLCHAVGVPRVLIANELIGATEIAMLAAMAAEAADREYYVLVDSVAGADALQQGFAACSAAPKARVLIEFGFPGGRCGVRSVADAVALAEAAAGMDRLILCGIEGYEGLIVTADPVADAANVDRYLADMVRVVEQVAERRLFDMAEPLVSAGGSVYYDLVARIAASRLHGQATMIARSGCYLTQDSGFYRRALENLAARDTAPALRPALQVWTRVLSVPEPGRAILSAGKRDVSFDIDLPCPELWFRRGEHATPQAIAGWRIAQLSDQHAFALSDGDASPLQVGDVVALGISHPCTTFDKWPLLLEVDEDFRVVDGLRTFF